jgi:hypothetical protein
MMDDQARAPGERDRIGRSFGGPEVKYSGDDPIAAYSQAQEEPHRAICDRLRKLIDAALPNATSKVWHGSPVWFVDDNPVVGYNATAKTVNLLFWNGQAFDEPGLKPMGKYFAAQALFRDEAELDPAVIRRWLEKARSNVFDSRGYFKKLREEKRSDKRS